MSTEIVLRRTTPPVLHQMQSILFCHWKALLMTFKELLNTPVATIVTATVIGISLSLPAGLYTLLQQAKAFSSPWQDMNHISLFLKKETDLESINKLRTTLQTLPHIEKITHITPQQALQEFRDYSGFGEALDSLQHNPLPHVFIIDPQLTLHNKQQLEQLFSTLKTFPEIDIAQLDIEWLQRLYSLFNIFYQSILLISILFSLTVLLVIGNTIRLNIENKKEEIIVIKLVGGTNRFIRRPFLYRGLWYGVYGGLLAVLLVNGSLWVLQTPVKDFLLTYNSPLQLQFMPVHDTFLLVVMSMLLGLIGAILAVNKHLHNIELE